MFIFFSFFFIFFLLSFFFFFFFFFNDTATTEIYTLSLHDALPIWQYARGGWAGLDTPVSLLQHADFSTLRHHPHTRREAIKIAGHLRFGAATPPLAFPARFTGLTSGWRISYEYFSPDRGVLGVQSYVLTIRASRFLPHVGDLGVWANAPYVEIHPAPRSSTCTPHDPASENTSEIINGYRVVVKRMTTSGLLRQQVCAAR